jgi:hypothetical protein
MQMNEGEDALIGRIVSGGWERLNVLDHNQRKHRRVIRIEETVNICTIADSTAR